MNKKNGVVVVGSLHYDIMLNASHQPKKGETIIGKNWFTKFGGKGGNQAIASSSYNTPTKIISAVGDDDFGKYILDILNASQVNSDFIQIINEEKTGISVAISDNDGEYGAVVISGANFKINPDILNNSLVWQNSKILMLQNEVNEELNILAAKKAQMKGLRVCLNASPPKKLSHDLISNIDILIINQIEAEVISQEKISSIKEAQNISKKLTNQFSIIIITLGEEGVIVCEENNEPIHLPAKKIDVESTHGAGDVFAGIFCAALASNDDLLTAIKLANDKAAFHVSK
tara:strand:+ start:10466 stop:11329 length:864 start_codon:yes stop_codon:yes gene_type:complete